MPVDGEAGGAPSHNQAFYSFDLGNIHFLSLDSYGLENNQYRFTIPWGRRCNGSNQDLEANSNKEWVIAYCIILHIRWASHNSIRKSNSYISGRISYRSWSGMALDLVLCGHSHDYERSGLMKGHYGLEPASSHDTPAQPFFRII